MTRSLYILFVVLFLSSCIGKVEKTNQPIQPKSVKPIKNPETRVSQWDLDVEKIRNWVAQKGYDMKPTSQGIYYMITKEGVGVAHPDPKAKVTAHYEGTLLDGTKFDSSYDNGQPFTTKLTQVIKGWQIAIPLLKKGGKGKFVIPSTLAYKGRAMGNIPAHSILVFDIELVDFE